MMDRMPRRLLTVVGLILATLMFASVASAATYYLDGYIPSFGSETFDQDPMYATTQFNDINFKYSVNPYSSKVKPVKCSNLADISGYKTFDANNHDESVIASNVIDGTCFYINIDSPTIFSWYFEARVRS
jgi:hypothetical protein